MAYIWINSTTALTAKKIDFFVFDVPKQFLWFSNKSNPARQVQR